MRIEWDSMSGWLCAIILSWIIGKIWIVPWMGWWEVLWIVIRGQVGLKVAMGAIENSQKY